MWDSAFSLIVFMALFVDVASWSTYKDGEGLDVRENCADGEVGVGTWGVLRGVVLCLPLSFWLIMASVPCRRCG